MTLRHLRIFCAVCQHGSMSAAAQALFMTQPSVSQAIRELEAHCGTPLFERLGKRLPLTPAGEALYPRACAMLEEFDDLERDLAQSGQRQQLRIGANLTVGNALLHRYLNRLEALYPHAEIQVYVSRSSELMERLERNQLDLALTEQLGGWPDYLQYPFHEDRIVAVSHPEHPIFRSLPATAAQLAGQRLLLRERGAGVREQFERLMAQSGYACRPYWESISNTVLIHAAERREGVAVLAWELVREALESSPDRLREVPVTGLDFHRQLVFVLHRKKYRSVMIQAMAEIVLGRRL